MSLADVVEPRRMKAAGLVLDHWRLKPEDLALMDAGDSLDEIHAYRVTLYDVINAASEGLLATLVSPGADWVITVGVAAAMQTEREKAS